MARFTRTALLLVVVVLHLTLVVAGAEAAVLSDDFNDNVPDARLWQIASRGTGPSCDESGGRLNVRIPGGATAYPASGNIDATCFSRFRFRGDFDISVDYVLTEWPNASGVRVGFVFSGPNGDFMSLERTSFGKPSDYRGRPREVYVSYWVGPITTVATSDQAGRLRVTRSGALVSNYYWEGSKWVLLASRSVTDSDIGFKLGMWTDPSRYNTNQNVGASFDNFEVTSGQVIGLSDPSAGPVGYWKFDDPNDIGLDSSGMGNNGTPGAGYVSYLSSGRVGGAAQFKAGGNVGITVPYSSSLDCRGGLTIAAWVKPDVSAGTSAILTKSDTGPVEPYALWSSFWKTGNRMAAWFDGASLSDDSGISLPAGSWTHIAMTYDGQPHGAVKFYRNGALVASKTTSADGITVSGSPVHIGASPCPGPEDFQGLLDEVVLFDRAVSDSEVQELCPESQRTYTITPSAGAHGSISPAGVQTVASGGSKTFTITADAGYRIADVRVDGTSVGRPSSYPFTSITADRIISVSFESIPTVLTWRDTTTRLSCASSVRKNRTLRVTGSVSPAGPGTVRIVMTRKVGGRWKSGGSKTVVVVGGTYAYSFKPRYKGSWRIVATYSGGVIGTTTYVGSRSGTRGLTVR